MSAYIVTRGHIQFLIEAGIRMGKHDGAIDWKGSKGKPTKISYANADKIGQMLWNENIRSVNARYNTIEESSGYRHNKSDLSINPIEVIKAIQCYEFQSCEHVEWKISESRRYVKALKFSAIQCLDGYDNARWGAPIQWETM